MTSVLKQVYFICLSYTSNLMEITWITYIYIFVFTIILYFVNKNTLLSSRLVILYDPSKIKISIHLLYTRSYLKFKRECKIINSRMQFTMTSNEGSRTCTKLIWGRQNNSILLAERLFVRKNVYGYICEVS